MKTVKTIRLFYLIYTVYTLFALLISDYRPVYAFFGLTSIWGAYLLFHVGFYSVKSRNKENQVFDSTINDNLPKEKTIQFPLSNIVEWRFTTYFFILILAWMSAILSAKFYTGSSFIAVIRSFASGESSYYTYQRYFAQSGISSFSIKKIPYILMLAFLTIIMIWSVLAILLNEKKNKWWQWGYLLGVVSAYLFFGVARGTNFETYIVFIVISYCILQKMSLVERRKRIKFFVGFVCLGLIMVFIFRVVVLRRGAVFANKLCAEINYLSDRGFAKAFPGITLLGISVFSYLGYGIYTIGVSIYDIALDSISGLLALQIPNGFKLMLGQSLESILRNTIDLGVKWCPDYIKLLNLLGLPLFYSFLILLGRFTRRLQDGNYPILLKNVMISIIYIQMLSLPVGNFLVTSSSNELMVIFAIVWFVQYRHFHFKVHVR